MRLLFFYIKKKKSRKKRILPLHDKFGSHPITTATLFYSFLAGVRLGISTKKKKSPQFFFYIKTNNNSIANSFEADFLLFNYIRAKINLLILYE